MPLRNNYGGLLQAYALQTVLSNMGHEVKIINQKVQEIPDRVSLVLILKRIYHRYILRTHCYVFWEKYLASIEHLFYDNANSFIVENCHTFDCNSLSDLSSEQFDAIVVGSDQVWRARYYKNIEESYLSFAEKWNIKRIAYAASFGVADWEYSEDQAQNCQRLIGMFDAVSVREDDGVELCKKHFCIDAVHVLDPTLLLDRCYYDDLISQETSVFTPNRLFSYILDESDTKINVLNQIASFEHLVPFSIKCNRDNDDRVTIEQRTHQPIGIWLRSIRDSKLVVTDSFHACVFSFFFRPAFVVLVNSKRGVSRIKSLLSMFHLESRLIYSFEDYHFLSNERMFESVDAIHREWKEKSMSFIVNSLNVNHE